MAKYKFANGSRSPVPAEVVGSELEKLRKQKGNSFHKKDVVEAARPKNSPLHPAFEWDDKKAAEQYRLEQAGYLIRSIVLVETESQQTEGVRAFVSIDTGEEYPVYTSIIHAMQNPETREQVIERAFDELESFKFKYNRLQDFSELFVHVEKAQNVLKKARGQSPDSKRRAA